MVFPPVRDAICRRHHTPGFMFCSYAVANLDDGSLGDVFHGGSTLMCMSSQVASGLDGHRTSTQLVTNQVNF